MNNYQSEEPLDILIVVGELGDEEIIRLKNIPKFYKKKLSPLLFGILLKW